MHSDLTRPHEAPPRAGSSPPPERDEPAGASPRRASRVGRETAGGPSPAALLLLRLLREDARGKELCFTSQRRMARLLGRSVRMVRHYLDELRAAGLIEDVSRGVYRLIAAERQPVSSERQSVSSERKPIAASPIAAERQPVSSERKPVSSERKPVSGPSEKRREDIAAAAAGARGSENQKAEQQLVDLGLAPRLAREFAGDPERVADALVYFRLKQAEKKVGVGFLVDALRKPEDHGWKQVQGKWQPPPNVLRVRQEERARRERQEKEAQAKAASDAKRRRDFEAFDALRQRWLQQLSEARRREVLDQVKRKHPLLSGLREDGTFVLCEAFKIAFRE